MTELQGFTITICGLAATYKYGAIPRIFAVAYGISLTIDYISLNLIK